MKACRASLLHGLIAILTASGFAGASAGADGGRTFYVSSSTGHAGATGTSRATAWKGLDQVNTADLRPGDTVLFRRGDAWRGQLQPRSGIAGKPVTYARTAPAFARASWARSAAVARPTGTTKATTSGPRRGPRPGAAAPGRFLVQALDRLLRRRGPGSHHDRSCELRRIAPRARTRLRSERNRGPPHPGLQHGTLHSRPRT